MRCSPMATQQIGRGWGFGLHEALDQVGAVLGPLIVTAVLYAQGSYQEGFAVLLIPGVLTIGVLLLARTRYPNPHERETKVGELEPKEYPGGSGFISRHACSSVRAMPTSPLSPFTWGSSLRFPTTRSQSSMP
jgi:MFS family permease